MEQIRIAAVEQFKQLCATRNDAKLTSGAYKAFRAIKDTEDKQYRRIGNAEVVMEDFCWDNERQDFIESLRALRIKSMVITNTSSGLFDDLHGYAGLGCKMVGLCVIGRWDRWMQKEEDVKGIRFEL